MYVKATQHNEVGFGLIEVLIAMVVFAIGLLGVAALQVRGQQLELESYQRAQALILLQDMVERMNVNRPARNCYPDTIDAMNPKYVGSAASALPGCAGSGTIATRDRADADLAAWDAMLRGAGETLGGANVGAITGARGCVTVDAATGTFYTVAVAWQGEIATVSPTNLCAQNQYGNDALRRVISTNLEFANLN